MEHILQGSPIDSTNMKESDLLGSQKTIAEHSFKKTAAKNPDKHNFSKSFNYGHLNRGRSKPTVAAWQSIAEVLS